MQNLSNTEIDQTKQKRGRLILILIFLFFALPLIAVLLMHHYNWRPGGASHGEMITPVRKLTVASESADKVPSTELWNDKWSMVLLASNCEHACQSHLHDMRQIHVSLAKDLNRVQRVLITNQTDLSTLLNDYPDLKVINQSKDAVDELAKQFDMNGEIALTSNRTYLVDPLGNLVMSFKPETKAVDIRKDLVKLLRFSWAG